MNPRITTIFVLLSLFVIGSVFAEDKEEKWGKVTDEEWNLTAPENLPDAAAIVLFDIGSLEVPPPYEGAAIKLRRHVRIKILNKAGAQDAANVEIVGSDLSGFKAHTILRDGKKIEVSGKDRFVKKVGEEGEVTTFTFPALEDGCIIEYQYGYLQHSYTFLQPWYFQGDLYVRKSQFSIILWGGLNYNAYASNVPESLRTPTREELSIEKNGPVKFTWVLRDLFPIEDEPYMAAARNYCATLTCQLVSFKDGMNSLKFIKDWKTLGETLLEYYDEFTNSKGKLADTALALTRDITSPQDKIKRLYQYVRDEVLTQGNEVTFLYSQNKLQKVLEQKVGNGAEKNLLLMEMLRAVGVDAVPLLIGTRDFAAFNPEVFQLQQFNHLICLVTATNGNYLLDTGVRGVPFPYLPPDDITSGGLLLRKDASQTFRLEFPKRDSRFETASRMRIHADGSATCSTHVSLSGYQIYAKRDLLRDKPEDDKLRQILLQGNDAQFTLDSYSFTRDIDNDTAGIDLVLTLPTLCLVADKQLVCAPLIMAFKDNPFDKPRRFFPVDFAYPRTYMDVVDIVCDDGLTLAALPQNVRETFDGITFTRNSLSAGGSARIMTQLIIGKSIYPPASYANVRGVFTKIADAALEQTTITY